MIIAGERRWRAANLAGLREVPCIELDIDEKGIAEIALIENMQRKDLTVWEEADGLAALSSRYGYTHEEIAEMIVRRAPVSELKEAARANGMHTLQEDGFRKTKDGLTTLDEVMRVVFTGGH